MNTKAFSMLLISMLIASTIAIAMPQAKAFTTKFAIEPSPQTFGPAYCVGTTFTVDLMVKDVTALYGVDLQIGWDTDYIRYVSHVKHIPRSGGVGIMYSPTIGVKDAVDETASMPGSAPGTMYWLAEASMLPAAQFDGTGSAATMTFQIHAQPDAGFPDVTTYIHITDSTLADTNGLPIDHDRIDGEIIIRASLPWLPEDPLLKIDNDPGNNHTSGIKMCTTFTSDIMLLAWNETTGEKDLNGKWDVAGFDIVYNFNATLLDAVSVNICPPSTWPTGGTNLSWDEFWPNGILVVKNEIDNVAGTIWIVFLGLPGDLGVHTAPYGHGSIATITFHSKYDSTTYPPPTEDLTLSPTTIAGFPHPERLYAPWNGSDTAIPLVHFVQNADYTAYFKALGRSIDLFVCSYPDGFNGRGPNVPSDMVWPQKGIWLCANVTYNLWPVQQKDVAFEIRDPYSNIWGIFYNRTDSEGIACVFVRLPWPCDDPEALFGKWKVTATVDIACIVVNDTMEFKYDYRVNIWKTTLDKVSYKHCEYIIVTIDYGTYSNQVFNATFAVTAVDEVGVPFGFAYIVKEVGGQHPWCTYINGTTEIQIHIPKFAVAGVGTIYVGVLSDLPWFGGSAWYPTRRPETIVDFGIEAA